MSGRIRKTTLTRSFDHLKPPARTRFRWQNQRLYLKPRGAPAKDRIKWWNIQPGDKVRVISGGLRDMELVREVLSVDKTMNRVYLKGTQRGSGQDADNTAKHTHYSNVQLHLGKFDFTPPEGTGEPVSRDVFATRLATSTPFYSKKLGFWIWNRYAAASAPAFPRSEGQLRRQVRIHVPWPKQTAKAMPPVGAYDTKPEDALAITWKPFPVGKQVCFNSLQDEYLRSMTSSFNALSVAEGQSTDGAAQALGYDEASPMEYYLDFELSNPHSRAKKQARWQDKISTIEEMKGEFIEKELDRAKKTGPGAELGGRRVKPHEAEEIASWKWKTEVEKMEKKAKYQRYIARGGLEEEKKRHERSARKIRRQQEKLRKLVLVEDKNQVVPSSQRT